MSNASRTIALVSPPWRPPAEPCLALATLSPLIAAAGWSPVTHHTTLHYPDVLVDGLFMASYSAHLFGALLVPEEDRPALIGALVQRFTADLNLHGLLFEGATLADLERDEEAMRTWVLRALRDAEHCVEAAAAHIAAGRPAVILMSATFEGQVVGAIALARRLRARGVMSPIALGGAACFEEAARALVEHYPELSAVCFTEGEGVVVALVETLADDGDLGRVPGIAWRDTAVRVNARPKAVRLDESPLPDYDDYFREWPMSPWRDLAPRLFLELSRGCWWGMKHLCTFCGLNANSLDFRDKSPTRAAHEVKTLHERYPAATRLAATDNILAMRYLDTVLPALEPLADGPRPLRLFFEVKSNLRKDQLRKLHRAGIRHVQPGIESFDDEVLLLMKKGNTGLGQIQFIKWCAEVGIQVSYNLIVMNPGESTAAYRRMLPLVDALDHLPSPDHVTPVWLERFAPYHQNPDHYGIRAVTPRSYYRAIYPDLPAEALNDLAYVFDFECDALNTPDHRQAVRDFALRVGQWQWEWEELTAWHHDRGTIELVDTRPGRQVREVLDEEASALYRWLDEVRPRHSLDRFGPRVPELLQCWRERGHVVSDTRDRWLATLPSLPSEPGSDM